LTPTILKKNQEINVICLGQAIEMKAITTRMQGIEAMMKFNKILVWMRMT